MSEWEGRDLIERQVPLRGWKVQNFKSIPEAKVDFAPLTVLVGANSSGKSSLIQAILMVVQAAQIGTEGSSFPLNGSLLALGGFDDLLFVLAERKEAVIQGTLVLSSDFREPGMAAGTSRGERFLASQRAFGPSRNVTWRVAFDSPSVDDPGSADISSVQLQVQPAGQEALPGVGAWLRVTSHRRGQGGTAEDLDRLRIGQLAWPTREDFVVGHLGSLQGSDLGETEVKGIRLRAGIPQNVLTSWTLREVVSRVWVEARTERSYWVGAYGPGPRARRWELAASPRSNDVELLERWTKVAVDEISEWDRQRRENPVTLPSFLARQRGGVPPDERQRLRAHAIELIQRISERIELQESVYLPPEAETAAALYAVGSDLHRFFRERVVYLGPLREDPQIAYKATPGGPSGFIGTKGEYMAAVLHASRAREVVCPRIDGSAEATRLVDALDYWAAELDIADSVQTKDLGRLGIQVAVTKGQIGPLDLTSVGVGVSQLLPVLVTCLLAPPGSLILLEQPELHLHPAVQQRLGDFLLACSKSGRQLIVETHSEYLVSRLRRRIAEDASNALMSTIALVFAEYEDGRSTFRPVETNEFGAIEDWPRGFFDQTSTESKRILEAGLEKRLRVGASGGGSS